MSDTAIIALAGVVTTIAGFLFQGWQMQKKFEHQQAIDAAARASQQETARRTAADLARSTEDTAAELKRETSEIKSELRENTKMTGMAYNAANNFEIKLEKLARVFDSVHTDREVQKQLLEISTDTNETVHKELQPDVAAIKDIVEHERDA